MKSSLLSKKNRILEVRKRAEQIYLHARWYNAKMVLATKGQNDPDILYAALPNTNIIIAENKIQEAEKKWEILSSFPNPKHFIGKLQKNKVRKAILMFDMIHSVDSFELLERINEIAEQENKTQAVMININISNDPNKSGVLLDNVLEVFTHIRDTQLNNVDIHGLFTMLQSNLSDDQIKKYYGYVYSLFKKLNISFCASSPMKEVSMGMSKDYDLALKEGSTMIRVGRGVFGESETYC